MLNGKQCRILLVALLFLFSTFSAGFAGTSDEGVEATVSEGKSVTMEYTVSLEDKKVVYSNVGHEPTTFTQGDSQLFPDLEKGIEGMKVGEERTVELSPEQSFGPVRPDAIVDVEMSRLPPDAQKIDAIVETKGASGQPYRGRVVSIEGETAKVDFNHPMAGKTVFFKVKVLQID